MDGSSAPWAARECSRQANERLLAETLIEQISMGFTGA
jgi:hypothetical protein